MMSPPENLGLYYVRNVASGTRLYLDSGDDTNGTAVQGWHEGDVDNQQWGLRLHHSENGVNWFVIECRASMTVLDLSNGSNTNGTRVQGWDMSADGGIRNQLWNIIPEGNDRYRIRNQASGTDLDLDNGSSDNGTRVQGWDAADIDNQRWTFEEVSPYLSFSEGHYQLFGFDGKISKCRYMIDRAKSDDQWKHCYGIGFNMSRLGLYNPIEFQQYAASAIDNLLDPNNIGVDGKYRIGDITFDFYENNMMAVQNVIRSNRGCAGIGLISVQAGIS